jgi:hypothetical protein
MRPDMILLEHFPLNANNWKKMTLEKFVSVAYI